MVNFILGIFAATAVYGWVHRRFKKEQEFQFSVRATIISRLQNITARLMPENPCEAISPSLGIKCMRPATHTYAGLAICAECAQALTQKGANPSPVKI